MPLPSRLRSILPALAILGGCSVINHFDDVKPAVTATAGNGGSGPTGGAGLGGASTSGNAGSVVGDSGMAGSGGAADAAPDANIRLLNCRFVIGSATGGHRKLDDLSQVPGTERVLADKFFMLPTGNGTSVRILTQLKGQQTTYLEYFASDVGIGTQPPPVVSNGRLVDAHKLDASRSGALIIESGGTGGPRLLLHTFDDATYGAQPVVSAVTNAGALGTSGNIDAIFSPDSSGVLAVAASFGVSSTTFSSMFGLYTLGSAPIGLLTLLNYPTSSLKDGMVTSISAIITSSLPAESKFVRRAKGVPLIARIVAEVAPSLISNSFSAWIRG